MDIEEIENQYHQEMRVIEQRFLDGIKNNQNIKKLEKEYKEKVKISRNKYYRLITLYINKNKGINPKLKKVQKKEEKASVLKIEPGNFSLSFFQRTKLKLGLFFFKLRFRIRNFKRAHTPLFISYFYIRFKFRLRYIISRIKDITHSVMASVRSSLILSWEAFKIFLKKIAEFSNWSLNKIKSMMSKKKEEKSSEKKEEKKED